MPVRSKLCDDDGEEYLVLASYFKNGKDFANEFYFGFEKRSMVRIFNSDNELERSRVLGEIVSDSLHIQSYREQYNMYGMEIFYDAQGNLNLFIAYSDTVPRPRLARLSFDNLETEDEMFLPMDEVGGLEINIHNFPWGNLNQGENMIACIASDGRVVAVDPVEMVETERGAFGMNCIGSDVDNFDDDELLELVYLSDDALYLFDVTPLSTPPNTQPTIPTTYSIQSAYPNPFNSKTMIEYTLPRAGRYALVVYDVTGAEVTRHADEWNVAGKYRIAWDATDNPAGLYFCWIGGEGISMTQKVVLVK